MPGIGAPWSYIAELEVHHARIFDCCEPKNGDAPFARLAEQVAALQAFLTLHRYDRPPHKLPIHRPPHHFKINSPWSSQMARSHNCRIMSECDTDSRIFPAFPGLKWDHPRQLAVMHALVRFAKLKAQGSVHKVPNTRRYRLVGKGYSICVVFLKLFERIYAPLTCGLLAPFSPDKRLATEKRSQLDRLYACVTHDLDELLRAVGLNVAA